MNAEVTEVERRTREQHLNEKRPLRIAWRGDGGNRMKDGGNAC